MRRVRYREKEEGKEEAERARAWSFHSRDCEIVESKNGLGWEGTYNHPVPTPCHEQLRFSCNLFARARAVVMVLQPWSPAAFFGLRMTASSSLHLSMNTGAS